MTSKQRSVTVLAAFIGVGLASGYFFAWRPFATRGRQLSTLVQMEAIERHLAAFHGIEHRYPNALTDLSAPQDSVTDPFGNAFLYLSDGSGFVLVGLGADGRPDGTNYLLARESGGIAPGECRDRRTDLIVSDRGWHRRCGK